ncbi:MAG: FmdB family zinc ribbon protein, partial [Methylococcales bacterium]
LCNRTELKKLISAVGFRLKGGGWYETDFKGGEKKKNLQGDKAVSESPTSTESSSTKTEKSEKTEKVEKTAS